MKLDDFLTVNIAEMETFGMPTTTAARVRAMAQKLAEQRLGGAAWRRPWCGFRGGPMTPGQPSPSTLEVVPVGNGSYALRDLETGLYRSARPLDQDSQKRGFAWVPIRAAAARFRDARTARRVATAYDAGSDWAPRLANPGLDPEEILTGQPRRKGEPNEEDAG